ncbi:RHS repeat-associated core domain-containing protein [Pseudomonas umsongensis]|jgi:RHS repeat-associated protein|uniref:RHS repeat-associated core domain-containing protein n=1 Tax=Pseudomonas umsongensis TaxID=198618 RepID=UPI0015B8DB6B|nr:RHS repeat-associated core domain-containing protein [Pseudomonas umsongensis]NWL20800.1 hypothetical protein [Pseudomonas umsongensis]
MSNARKTHLIHYRYDALDRLASHVELNNPECQRFYCDSRPVTEIEGSERLSIVQHEDQLLAQQQRQSNDTSSTLLATDLQRSVLNALQARLQQTTAYSPYGCRTHESGLISLLGFNGQRPDPVTGHYLLGNGYRGFNPALMRFNSPDNQSPFGDGGVNPYAYGLGDPINRADPTGRFASGLISRIQAKYHSYRTGLHVTRQENPMQIAPGIFTYTDKYRGGSRVTFEAHGLPNVIQAGGGKFIGAEQLNNIAKQHGVHAERYVHVRLLVCYSAEPLKGQAYSIGHQFSVITGRPVKAYFGGVLASSIPNEVVAGPVGKRFTGTFNLWMDKEKFSGGDRFRSVIFRPEKIVRENAGIRK